MIDLLKKYIKTHQLFDEHAKLIVGVSGGVDSMVLIDILRAIGEDWPIKLIVAHFNYQLRGEESDLDEALVQAYCDTHKLNFENVKADKEQLSSLQKQALQETARKLRFEWFEQLRAKHKADRIVLAHHADDNIETILYHLTKGTGIAGLRGMKPKNDQQVVRPFLSLSKDDILSYAQSHQIVWREDLSNQKAVYARNTIRLKVLPVLKNINPSLSDHFDDTHSRLLGLEQLVNQQLSEIKDEYQTITREVETWNTLWVDESEMGLMLLSELLKEYGFNYRDSQDIHEAILQPTGQMFFSEQFCLNVNKNYFQIEAKSAHFDEAVMPILKGEKDINYGSFSYTIEYLPSNKIKITPDTNQAFLDIDKLDFPLQMRKWKNGDRMQPFGLHGRKKISDILIDDKVSNLQKEKVHVLMSGEEIVWLAGVRVGHVARVTNDTKQVLVITRH